MGRGRVGGCAVRNSANHFRWIVCQDGGGRRREVVTEAVGGSGY